ncbi:MAG: hypothetical protein K6U80_04715 [Firmicutes bacterium]|nr:hypothetical protein [Bacillota bacterium]
MEQDQLFGIAIIGMAGRFPKAKNIREFWQNLCCGAECITHYSEAELAAVGIDREILKNPNYVRARGHLDGIDMFDAAFFGVNPREAELMDPQHRLLLECSWEAMEDAGYDPGRYRGRVGVYAGESMNTYVFLNVYPYIEKVMSAGSLQAAIGNDKDSLTTTIAYKLNLRGPAITIQSSSSTSLTAVCIAAQGLLNYHCDLALAGGISVGSPPKSGYLYESRGIVSPEGHCRPFDARAKGFVPGNGMGLVVLKRLSEALEDGDQIYGIIKGFAINNDGSAKVSYSAPSVGAQAEVIAEAQAMAGIEPESIGYVEAHGTGTEMGDPIEFTALSQAFQTSRKSYCALGSVKGNIGHLDTAAGVVGLMKATLALKNRMIPPSINFNSPNPQIDPVESPFYINDRLRNWVAGESPRRAGVTSLGMGGTNAHVVIEEAPEPGPQAASRARQLLLFSAKTEAALDRIIRNFREHLAAGTEANLADMAYTLQVGRREFNYRRFLVCRDCAEAVRLLDQKPGEQAFFGYTAGKPDLNFVITGGAGFHPDFIAELDRNEPVFHEHFSQCALILKQKAGLDITRVSPKGKPGTEPPELEFRSRMALLAAEYALAQLLIKWGITPRLILGDGLGIFMAACLAGVCALEESLALAVAAVSPEIREQFTAVFGKVKLNPPRIAMISAAGGIATTDTLNNCDFWLQPEIENPGVNGLLANLPASANPVWLELSPGQKILRLLGQNTTTPATRGQWVSFKWDCPEPGSAVAELLFILGKLWLAGATVFWEEFYAGEKRRRVSLPSYPFEGRSYWLAPKKLRQETVSIVGTAMDSVLEGSAGSRPKIRLTGKEAPAITEMERRIARIWQEILGFEVLDLNDNFFEIGGDSVSLIKLHTALEKEFPGMVQAQDLFAYPTITRLSQFIYDQQACGQGGGQRGIEPAEIASLREAPPETKPKELKEDIMNLLKEGQKGNLSMDDLLNKFKKMGG